MEFIERNRKTRARAVYCLTIVFSHASLRKDASFRLRSDWTGKVTPLSVWNIKKIEVVEVNNTFFKWVWIYCFLFASLVSCEPKRSLPKEKIKHPQAVQAQGSELLLDFIDKYKKVPEYRFQKKDEDNPNLFALPNRKQMDILIMRLTRTGDARRRLLQMKSSAVPYLCVALLSPERFSLVDIRQECALLLGEIKDPVSIKSLILGMKNDEEIIVQLTCINALSKFRSQEAVKPMRELFLSDETSTFLKSALAIALADVGDREIIPHLQKWTEKPPPEQFPYRSSKRRYLYWHLKESSKILTGERNTYSSLSAQTPGVFFHGKKEENEEQRDHKKEKKKR